MVVTEEEEEEEKEEENPSSSSSSSSSSTNQPQRRQATEPGPKPEPRKQGSAAMASPTEKQGSRWQDLDKLLARPGNLVGSDFEPNPQLKQDLQEYAKVLVVGAGGLGCELLEDLALMGFRHIEVIDMDTIETSTLVLTVNLSCCRCYMKIRKTLCKFEEIQCLIFDEKQNMVTISGRFDPEKLEMKLRCKARNCITGCEIKIVDPPPKGKPPPPVEPPTKPPPANPPPSLAITVNVIGIPILPYVPKVCQSQRPCYEVICEDGIFPPPSVPKRCHRGCGKDEICSCSGYGSGSICNSPSFW